MEFESEKTDYSVAEFNDSFGHHLPKIVTVNQGFCGDITDDTFDRGQIIRIQTVSRQKRVVAMSEHGNKDKLYSIPLGYQATLCAVNKKGKVGKEQSLKQILKEHSLPVTVKFPMDHTINIGGSVVSTNHIPPMDLIQDFDEMYLLGNNIIDGELVRDVIDVPLYLTDLRLSLVTGIKGQSKAQWNSYRAEITRTCRDIKYNPEFGNKEIAVYHEEAFHSDTMYALVEPAKYANLMHVFPAPADDACIVQTPSPTTSHKSGTSSFKRIPPDVPKRNDSQRSNENENPKCAFPQPTAVESPKIAHKPPPILPKPDKTEHEKEETWEFVTEKEDYNVAEFNHRYGHSLPNIAMITQGYSGGIVDETYARGQIVRFHTLSRQRRVIAKTKIGNKMEFFSISLSYYQKFCFVYKNGKVEKEKPLYQIIEENSLPMKVQLPAERTATIGGHAISSDDLTVLELTKTYDEMCLLGNFIRNGEMGVDVTAVPLYLPELRFCLVTGLKNQNWEVCLHKFQRDSSASEYDLEYGNAEIAVYSSESINMDTDFSYVEPKVYSNLRTIFKKTAVNYPAYSTSGIKSKVTAPASFSANSVDSANVYEEVGNAPEKVKQKRNSFVSQMSNVFENMSTTNAHAEPPKLFPKPKHWYDEHTVNKKPHCEHTPEIPDRIITQHTKQYDSVDPPNLYENEVPRGQVSPVTRPAVASEHNKPEITESNKWKLNSSGEIQSEDSKLPQLRNADDIAKLTIDDVGEYLKLLHLGQFVDKFKDQMVDGVTLLDYDKDVLVEFGFKASETIRLLKFARDGHVPK